MFLKCLPCAKGCFKNIVLMELFNVDLFGMKWKANAGDRENQSGRSGMGRVRSQDSSQKYECVLSSLKIFYCIVDLVMSPRDFYLVINLRSFIFFT
jgi:hypothetical protein